MIPLLLALALAAEPAHPPPPPPEVRGPPLPIPSSAPGPTPGAPAAPETPLAPAPLEPRSPAVEPGAPAAAPPASDPAGRDGPALQDAAHEIAAQVRAEPPPASAAPAKAPLPPGLTTTALADELRRGRASRATERQAAAGSLERLERLRGEISQARALLREETAKLEALLKTAATAVPAGGAGRRPSGPGRRTPLEDLATTVKSMRAEQSAALLGKLDRPLAASLLGAMKPADAGAIIEKMEPAAGAELIALLARRGAR